jgi:4-hydroxy-tetrahydrodipicolinate synthase
MKDAHRFDGVFTAVVTPFDDAGEIDWHAFDASVDRQLAAGVSGLVPVGTTGEAATLSAEEADKLIARTVARVQGRAYVLAGTGSNSTRKTVEASRRAAELGADGILVVTPYYNRPSQAGLRAHFAAVADAVSCDVMLYSVPARAGVAIAPETAAYLARDHANIVAIKEAGGDPARVSDLRAATGPDFVVHSGDDGLALAFFALGARGLTSVFSNFDPEICVALHRAWSAGDPARALEIHEVLRPIAEAMFIENSPAPVKYLLGRAGHMQASARLPIAPVSAASRDTLDRCLEDYRGRRQALHLGQVAGPIRRERIS